MEMLLQVIRSTEDTEDNCHTHIGGKSKDIAAVGSWNMASSRNQSKDPVLMGAIHKFRS